jgi:DNA repair exonuclease SbcCD ATPase subunit
MKPEDRLRVAEVIEKNTQRVALGELAAAGKSHVRVISAEKTLALIEAVVEKAIARRAGELADVDRERVVQEANEQFQRVVRIQADAEALAEQQREMIRNQAARIAALEQAIRKSASVAKRHEKRLDNARETILSYDQEIERLGAQVRRDVELIEDLRKGLEERASEVQGLRELLRGLTAEAETRAAAGVDALRSELREMKSMLKEGAPAGTVDTLLARLSEREAASTQQLESRFEAGLKKTLDSVSKTLHLATARPLDRPVEATDAMLARIFDRADEMDSNLSRLEVEASTAKAGIEDSLDRLKRLKEQALSDDDAEEAAPPA